MLKVIAVGDVHADYGRLWAALRAAYAADASGRPTPPVLDGRYRVVLVGDLVHAKSLSAYEELTGLSPYNPRDATHLQAASRAQARELERVRDYADESGGTVTVLLGNHDAAALDHRHVLGTGMGLVHLEFDASAGGLELPVGVSAWMRTWPGELRLHGVQFAHAGPLPGMASYDDFFYGDPDTKTWWQHKPGLVRDAGFDFGVYGHTVMPQGVYLEPEGRFAMIDALDRRQYLEVLFRDDGSFEHRVASF